MTIVSSKEFTTNQDKYFDMALNEQVYIKKGNNMFLLIYSNVDDMNIYHDASVYEEVLEPDDDFRRAISADEFKKRCLQVIDRIFQQ
jgi:hypothetical protein